jgi:DNA-binding transcriptional ArsR family regulator
LVSALAAPTGLALPTVMRHLACLEAANLMTSEKTERTRMCRTNPQTLVTTLNWMADQRAKWQSQTDRLEAYFAALMNKDSP